MLKCWWYIDVEGAFLMTIWLLIVYRLGIWKACACCYFGFRWVKLSGTDLLPGDVVSVGRASGPNGEEKSIPADMLLLAGSAIVNEAILTGESTPQWKVVFFPINSFIFLNAKFYAFSITNIWTIKKLLEIAFLIFKVNICMIFHLTWLTLPSLSGYE